MYFINNQSVVVFNNNKFEGFTGNMEFDEYGDRKEIELRAYTVKNNKIEKFNA